MRSRNSVSVLAAAALAVTAASAAPAAAGSRAAHDPIQFTVKVGTVTGSGCPKDTVWAAARDDGKLTVNYTDYLAQAGGSSRPVDARKNCQLSLQLTAPQDVTYAISSSYHPIWATLESGANATLKFGHYFQGLPGNGMVAQTLNGPHDDDWRVAYQEPADKLLFQPCGEQRSLVLTTELRVDKGTSDPSKTSFVSMDSLSDGPRILYELTWKNCPR
ncbi:DUF4360 domain-containing protein [Actinomadura decatromicini]|uniref:DUF4360 domain-containing protein n=1 Tax=Actinomadura decatromicini TaxID=2604572 RepID=A0A5D3FT55_9ACTN|nr:DUF4360 domain-containing protein [Actinomadura decatromicini]TYK51393.1 DUF4360 domain-containing protein [Actinomadura decatromicini]